MSAAPRYRHINVPAAELIEAVEDARRFATFVEAQNAAAIALWRKHAERIPPVVADRCECVGCHMAVALGGETP